MCTPVYAIVLDTFKWSFSACATTFTPLPPLQCISCNSYAHYNLRSKGLTFHSIVTTVSFHGINILSHVQWGEKLHVFMYIYILYCSLRSRIGSVYSLTCIVTIVILTAILMHTTSILMIATLLVICYSCACVLSIAILNVHCSPHKIQLLQMSPTII